MAFVIVDEEGVEHPAELKSTLLQDNGYYFNIKTRKFENEKLNRSFKLKAIIQLSVKELIQAIYALEWEHNNEKSI